MFNHLDRGDTMPVDRTVEEATADEFDGLVLPGGVANADKARMDPNAVRFVRSFFDAGKPAAVICHAPWLLVEADVVRGRTPSGSGWSPREVQRLPMSRPRTDYLRGDRGTDPHLQVRIGG